MKMSLFLSLSLAPSRFQGELQLVFMNQKYSSVEEALEQSDGFAIIALLLETQERDQEGKIDHRIDTTGFRVIDWGNRITGIEIFSLQYFVCFYFQKFIRAAKRYAKATKREQSPKFKRKGKKPKDVVVDLKLGKFLSDIQDIRKYITYQGSFTSPKWKCKDAVTWIVYTEPLPVLEAFVRWAKNKQALALPYDTISSLFS